MFSSVIEPLALSLFTREVILPAFPSQINKNLGSLPLAHYAFLGSCMQLALLMRSSPILLHITSLFDFFLFVHCTMIFMIYHEILTCCTIVPENITLAMTHAQVCT
jgi:hypothetical protein